MVKDLRIGDTFEVCRNKKLYAGFCVLEIAVVDDIGKREKPLDVADIKFYPIITTSKKTLVCLDVDSINGNTRIVLTEKSFKPISESAGYAALFEKRRLEREINIVKSGINMSYNSSKTIKFPGIIKNIVELGTDMT